MVFFVEVSLESQSEGVLEAFEAAAIARPEVLECYLTTGSADYLIKVSLVMKTVKPWTGYPPRRP